jgi:methylphosphotriester-DNA--protein-cysteine methyltransferase
MRASIPALLILFSLTTLPLSAAGLDDKASDQQSIDALTVRASQAQPREQCVLYAELVHQMTELSLRRYAAGDVEKSSSLLHQIQQLTGKIHLSVANNDKRLRQAEILLRHAAFRLTGMLHSSSYEDQALVAQTLAQVNQVQSEAMMQVFRK